jgi:hypothetical protein
VTPEREPWHRRRPAVVAVLLVSIVALLATSDAGPGVVATRIGDEALAVTRDDSATVRFEVRPVGAAVDDPGDLSLSVFAVATYLLQDGPDAPGEMTTRLVRADGPGLAPDTEHGRCHGPACQGTFELTFVLPADAPRTAVVDWHATARMKWEDESAPPDGAEIEVEILEVIGPDVPLPRRLHDVGFSLTGRTAERRRLTIRTDAALPDGARLGIQTGSMGRAGLEIDSGAGIRSVESHEYLDLDLPDACAAGPCRVDATVVARPRVGGEAAGGVEAHVAAIGAPDLSVTVTSDLVAFPTLTAQRELSTWRIEAEAEPGRTWEVDLTIPAEALPETDGAEPTLLVMVDPGPIGADPDRAPTVELEVYPPTGRAAPGSRTAHPRNRVPVEPSPATYAGPDRSGWRRLWAVATACRPETDCVVALRLAISHPTASLDVAPVLRTEIDLPWEDEAPAQTQVGIVEVMTR